MATIRVIAENHARTLIDLPTGWTAVEEAYKQFGSAPGIQSQPSVMIIADPQPALGRWGYRVKGANLPASGTAGALLFTQAHPYIYLWSTETDAPVALVACDWLLQFRVAVSAAVAIKALAPSVRKIALFGAGKYARETCRLLVQHWPNAELQVLAARLENARALASAMPRSVVATDDPRAAIRGADVIVTLTSTKEPFVHGGWLSPGSLLLSMGSSHETDIAVLHEMDALIVDDLAFTCVQGDIEAWIRRGELNRAEIPNRVRANIGEVLANLKPGRMHPDERILAVIQGLTACDVAVAKAVVDRAIAEGVGQTVTL